VAAKNQKNQLGVAVMTMVAVAVVAWWRLPCDIVVAVQNGSGWKK